MDQQRPASQVKPGDMIYHQEYPAEVIAVERTGIDSRTIIWGTD